MLSKTQTVRRAVSSIVASAARRVVMQTSSPCFTAVLSAPAPQVQGGADSQDDEQCVSD